jgi:hypothetical protein
MRLRKLIIACAIAGFGSPAMAAVPKFSGDYILSMTVLCQAGMNQDVTPQFEARLETDLGTATFNNATKQVSFSGFTVFGQTIMFPGVSGGAMHQETRSFTHTYANTAKTLTFNTGTGSQGGAWKIVYGKLVNNVVQYAFIQMVGGASPPDNHCTFSGTIFIK